jgi:hypothetical protein
MDTPITGRIAGRLIRAEDHARWLNLELVGCVIVGCPQHRFDAFLNVAFVNCVFLYDGMEVEGSEWLSFMSMTRMPAKTPGPKPGRLA